MLDPRSSLRLSRSGPTPTRVPFLFAFLIIPDPHPCTRVAHHQTGPLAALPFVCVNRGIILMYTAKKTIAESLSILYVTEPRKEDVKEEYMEFEDCVERHVYVTKTSR